MSDGEEIACPHKITRVVPGDFKSLDILKPGFKIASYSDYHVITNAPEMFDINLNFNSNLANKMALITCKKANIFPQQTKCNSNFDISYLLENKCFTIFNGITLILAHHRNRTIDSISTLRYLKSCKSLHQEFIPEQWEDYYYNKNIPNIADFPDIYASFGNTTSDTVLKYLYKPPIVYYCTNSMGIFATSKKCQSKFLLQLHSINKYFNGDIVNPDYTRLLTHFSKSKRTMKTFIKEYKEYPLKWTGLHKYFFVVAFCNLYPKPRLLKILKVIFPNGNYLTDTVIKIIQMNKYDVPITLLKYTFQNYPIPEIIKLNIKNTHKNITIFFTKFVNINLILQRIMIVNEITKHNHTLNFLVLEYLKNNKHYINNI